MKEPMRDLLIFFMVCALVAPVTVRAATDDWLADDGFAEFERLNDLERSIERDVSEAPIVRAEIPMAIHAEKVGGMGNSVMGTNNDNQAYED